MAIAIRPQSVSTQVNWSSFVIGVLFSLLFPIQMLRADVVVGGPGEGGNCIPFGCPGLNQVTEFQELYAATEFPGPVTIDDIAFYRTQVLAGISVVSGHYEFSFSTSTKAVG